MFYHLQFFGFEFIENLLLSGVAINGIPGGFLIGNTHDSGGIPVLGKYNDVYRIAYEVEGGEYLLNPKATYVYLERLNEINNSERDKNFELTTFNQTSLIFKIDCTLENHHFFKSKFIILDSTQNQMVINKFSASKYLQEIESINNSSTLERGETPEADIRP